MMLHCPCCHAQFSIEAIIQDEAARELIGFKSVIPTALWSYLSLFRSEKRALSWERALKLAKEVLELADTPSLDAAMSETIEALRGKGGAPLKNHNYLKRVLENQGARSEPRAVTCSSGSSARSKADVALSSLSEWIGGDPIREMVAYPLTGLLALRLENTPAADTITRTADIWEHALRPKLSIPAQDSTRMIAASKRLIAVVRKWPTPAQLIELLPPRKQLKAVDNEISAEQRQTNKERLQELRRAISGE